MRKRIFLSGILILIAGLALLVSGASMQYLVGVKVAEAIDSWEATATLQQGNLYVIDINSSLAWQQSWTEGGFEDLQPIDAIIVSPDGNLTMLQGFFYSTPAVSMYLSPRPLLVEVQYQNVSSDSLEVDVPSTKIRFRVLEGGNFTCRVIEQTMNWTIGPPFAIVFYVLIPENKYAYMIPSGGALCIGGLVVSLLGARSFQKPIARKGKVKIRT